MHIFCRKGKFVAACKLRHKSIFLKIGMLWADGRIIDFFNPNDIITRVLWVIKAENLKINQALRKQ